VSGLLDSRIRPRSPFPKKIRNSKQIPNSNFQMDETVLPATPLRFEHSNLSHWILPFDMAQGGELVEPFRASPAFAEAAARRQVLRVSSLFAFILL
jgi:hypothetical protein